MDKQQVRVALREIDAERKNLDKREKALQALLATFEEPVKPRAKRVSGKVREQEILDLLRAHPEEEYDQRRIAGTVPMPYTTAGRVMFRLAEAKQVKLIGDLPESETARTCPPIKHKPVRVVPGSKAA